MGCRAEGWQPTDHATRRAEPEARSPAAPTQRRDRRRRPGYGRARRPRARGRAPPSRSRRRRRRAPGAPSADTLARDRARERAPATRSPFPHRFNRTPRPPPWLTAPSPISSIPAAASASTSFIRESTLPRITPSLDSMRWIVGSESPERWARSRWSISSSARAARIWGPVIMFQISESVFHAFLSIVKRYELKSQAVPSGARSGPEQQAGVAVGIEPVASGDGMGVGALHHLEAGKRRDQHEQCRARQVEIGEHHVDGAEAIARRDKQGGLPMERFDGAVVGAGALDQP